MQLMGWGGLAQPCPVASCTGPAAVETPLLSLQPKTFLLSSVVQPVCSVLGILSIQSETIPHVKGSDGLYRPLTSPTPSPAYCLLPSPTVQEARPRRKQQQQQRFDLDVP